MKRIFFTSYGTRGDIQPFVALGKALKAAGYEVSFCTSAGFRSFIEENGLHYSKMSNEVLELSQAVLGDVSPFETMQIAGKIAKAMRRSFDEEWKAAQDFQPDLVIHPKYIASHHIAEKLGIPTIISLPLPFYTPTKAFPVPFFAAFPKFMNRLSYFINTMSALGYAGSINDFRTKTLGLPKMSAFNDMLKDPSGKFIPILYPYSSHLLPVPAEFPPHVHVTGYWFLERNNNWQPSPELLQFLEDGKPPIYIGFGSMGARGAEKRAKVVLEALQQTGERGLLAKGWGGLKTSDLPKDIFVLDEAPHDWLFPRVAATVHHGGAGTTAASLRAEKPLVIVPFLGDQPFWGKLVYEAGLGAKPIPQNQLTVDALADAIRMVTEDKVLVQKAANFGEKIRAEDGLGNAVKIVKAVLGD
jgi:sterol 3beta-glucosyltransferase